MGLAVAAGSPSVVLHGSGMEAYYSSASRNATAAARRHGEQPTCAGSRAIGRSPIPTAPPATCCCRCSRDSAGAGRTPPASRCTRRSHGRSRSPGCASRRTWDRPRPSSSWSNARRPSARIDRVTRRPSLVRLELERRGTVDELRAAVERPSEDVEIVSLGRHLELVKQVGLAAGAGGHVRDRRGAGQPRHRAHPAVHREPGRPQPLAAVLGARRGRPGDGPQRPHHELPQAPPALRAARRPVLHGERLRGDRRLSRRPAGPRVLARRGARPRRSTTSTAASRTSSRPPDAIGFARDPFALKPLITVETDAYVAIANEEIAIRAALGSGRRRARAHAATSIASGGARLARRRPPP